MKPQDELKWLNRLPPQTVEARGRISIGAAKDWAASHGHEFVVIDLAAAHGKREVMTTIGAALQFPIWYGANLDALFDCLTDLPDQRASTAGWLIVLDGLSAAGISDGQRHALLDVFRDATASFARLGLPFLILYS